MATAPTAPITDIWPSCSSGQIRFIWRPPTSDGGDPITKYTLACTAIAYSQDVSANVASFTVTGLTNGTDYAFTVTATNAIGASPVASFPVVQPGARPFGPTVATVSTLNASTALITWTPSTIAAQGSTRGYIILCYPSTTAMSSFSETQDEFYSSMTFTGLSTNTYYRFLVQGINDVGYCVPFAYTSTIGFGTIFPFSPSSLAGMQVWYDGSDPLGTGTAPANGTSISTWFDKSGQGYNATSAGTTATYSSAEQTLNMALNSYYTTSYSASLANESVFAIFKLTNANQAGIIGASATGGRGMYTWNTPYWLEAGSIGVGGYTTTTSNSIRLNSSLLASLTIRNNTWSSWIDSANTRASATAANSAGRTTNIGASGATANYIYEVNIYNQALTPFDRQKVEGYLAWKWGLQSQLPTTHPFRVAAPILGSVFSPSSFSGLQLWIDAQDFSKVTLGSGSTITALTDKSSNAYTFSNVSGYGYSSNSFNTSYPSFTAPGVSGNSLGSNASFTLSNPNTVFFVGKNDKAGGNYSFVYNTPQNTHTVFMNPNDRYSMYAGGVSQADNLSITGTNQSNIIISAVFNGAASAFVQNGSTITSGFNPGTSNITAGLVLGQWYIKDDKAWGGKFCEFMMFSNVLSTDDRQTVEGYLAWKWGLNGALPTTHPYKLVSPASNYTDTIVPYGLLVNFTATTYSGSGAWSNAGALGANYNATVEAGTPSKNGAGNGVVFNGATNFTFSNISVGNAWTAAVWAKRTGSNGSGACYLTQGFSGSAINMSIFTNNGGLAGSNQVAGGFFAGSAWRATTAQTLDLNTWYHLQYTWDGTRIRFYVNGTLTASNAPGIASSDAGLAYRIGRVWSGDTYIVGEIGQILIYNRAITAAEVAQNYAATSNVYTV
jgi:hypothetical protein